MEEKETEASEKISLIKYGGGSMTSLKKSDYYGSTRKLKLNPL